MDATLSPVLTALISAGVSYFVTVFLKEKEYKNDYYKKVIDKRLVACENLEKFLVAINFTSTGEDKRTYYAAFGDSGQYNAAMTALRIALETGMWLGHKTRAQLHYLNSLLINGNNKNSFSKIENATEFAKANYETMKSMRIKLVEFLKYDLYTMHDVHGFFKNTG